ncbi:polysaccharide transporter, PST family [Cyclobacterium lianum]|uniref:Polysaccharide transporter, PST family n=1 Tax=Cyclobacterium lianum TaxID=388280 RepID=A0A1M7JV63_9BACT|nr:oligosaccharide flippase family protein [Cyclobacterium lianum]SHM56952.1 polysaccharide transporter, PST family [Cyclobacterium lianum]
MLEKTRQLSFFSFIRHKSIRNFFFLFLIQASNILISLLAMPVLIRAIGVAEFGLVNLAFSVVLLVNVLVSFGYNLSGPRDIALSEGNNTLLGRQFSEILSSKIALAFLAVVSILSMGFFFGFFADYRRILAWSTILLFAEATAIVWFFQGKEQLHWVSLANVFSKAIYLLLLLALIRVPADSYLANFFLGLTALMTNLALLAYVRFGMKVPVYWPKLGQIWHSWKKNVLLFLSGLTAHIAVNGGVIVLSFFASAQILGLYGMAERIGMVLRIVPTLVTQAAYPRASILFYQERQRFYSFLGKVQWASLFFTLLISLTVFALAPIIIRLMAGESLEESVYFLRILAFLPFLAALNIGNMLIILVLDEKKILFHATWLFCVYMLASAFLLTWAFGSSGLALALLSTELVAWISTTLLLHRRKAPILSEFYHGLFYRYHHS